MNKPHHAKPWMSAPGSEFVEDEPRHETLPFLVSMYQTPGPGPSSGIPKRDLELSKIEKAVEDIRSIIHTNADIKAAAVRFELSKIERATAYLKEH